MADKRTLPNTRVQHKQSQRDKLRRDVDEFHARGGETEVLETGQRIPPPAYQSKKRRRK